MSRRSGTFFYTNASFTIALDKFDLSVRAIITAHLLRFEEAWRASRDDGDVPAGFCLEFDRDVVGPYRLYQIRVGPKHGYRADVVFLDSGSNAYWVYTFKKAKNRQPEDMRRARLYAQQLWDGLQRREDYGTH